mgnify:CR=1 FL=1
MTILSKNDNKKKNFDSFQLYNLIKNSLYSNCFFNCFNFFVFITEFHFNCFFYRFLTIFINLIMINNIFYIKKKNIYI